MSSNSSSNSGSNSGSNLNSSPSVLEIILILIVPIGSAIAWWVRGYVENKRMDHQKRSDDIKQKTLNILEYQLAEFYWPMYLNLIRYRKYSQKYLEFKEGHYSLNSQENDENDSNKSSPVNLQHININFDIDKYPQPLPPPPSPLNTVLPIHLSNSVSVPVLEPVSEKENHQPSNDSIQSQSIDALYDRLRSIPKNPRKESNDSEIPKINTFFENIKEMPIQQSLSRLHMYEGMTTAYKKKMIERLLELQRIYTTSAPRVEPDQTLFHQLIELDQYITYVTAVTEDSYYDDKQLDDKFPHSIYQLINNRLVSLQEKYNSIIYDSHIHKDDMRIDVGSIDNGSSKRPIYHTIYRRRNHGTV